MLSWKFKAEAVAHNEDPVDFRIFAFIIGVDPTSLWDPFVSSYRTAPDFVQKFSRIYPPYVYELPPLCCELPPPML